MFPDPTMKGAMRNSRRMLQKTIDSDRLPTKRIALCGFRPSSMRKARRG